MKHVGLPATIFSGTQWLHFLKAAGDLGAHLKASELIGFFKT